MKERKYLTDFPELMKEFDWEANEGIDPSKISYGTKKKIWWKCSKGHKWKAVVNNRTNGTKCPECNNNNKYNRKRAIKGVNDLATLFPEIAKEWDYNKNLLKPTEVTSYSSKKIWWICPKYNHKYETRVSDRTKGNVKCPYCSEKRILKGFNDLATTNPELINEWDMDKNKIKITEVGRGSKCKVWWKCPKGHEWETRIKIRAEGCNCPYCSGKRVLEGFNDLATLFPKIAKEWDYEANKGLKPTEVTVNSGKKVYWKCLNGHKWQATIANRNCGGTNCPYCGYQTSFPEYAIEYYLKQLKIKVIHSYKKLGFELDLFLPELNVGIEYDGYVWHKTEYKKKKDIEKNKKCKKLGITLYRVREKLPSLNDTSIDICLNTKGINDESIKKLLDCICLNNTVSIDIKKDKNAIRELKGYLENKNGITINGITRSYSQWSFYFGYSKSYVSGIIKKHGLEETVKYLTKLYEERQLEEKDVA